MVHLETHLAHVVDHNAQTDDYHHARGVEHRKKYLSRTATKESKAVQDGYADPEGEAGVTCTVRMEI
jgi:hypothetical protein